MEGGTDLTLVATMIGTGVTVLVALFAFGVFFLRRLDTLIRDTRTELRSDIQGVRTDMGTEFASVRSEIRGVRNEMGTEFASVRNEIQGVRNEIQGVRTDFGPRIDGVNSRVDQVILAVSGPASEQAAASDPVGRAEKRPPAA